MTAAALCWRRAFLLGQEPCWRPAVGAESRAVPLSRLQLLQALRLRG